MDGHISKLTNKYTIPEKSKETERGELMRYFMDELNRCRHEDNQRNFTKWSKFNIGTFEDFQETKIFFPDLNFGRMASLLTHYLADGTKVVLPLPKLYRLKSICRQSKNFSSTFYWYAKGDGVL